jgi:DNA-directed RNA polymerase specialized sigma24 family protein
VGGLILPPSFSLRDARPSGSIRDSRRRLGASSPLARNPHSSNLICRVICPTVHPGESIASGQEPRILSRSTTGTDIFALVADLTQILNAAAAGDPTAAAELLPLVYDELRKFAAARMAEEKLGQTLTATALVHEAYLRLVGGEHPQDWNGRGHFFAAAAGAMRRIHVDHAHRKRAEKHGGDLARAELPADLPAPSRLFSPRRDRELMGTGRGRVDHHQSDLAQPGGTGEPRQWRPKTDSKLLHKRRCGLGTGR